MTGGGGPGAGRRAPVGPALVLAVLVAIGLAVAWRSPEWSPAGPAPQHAPAALPATGAGPTVVALSADARTHPVGEEVRAQLQRHYDAINARDYAAWAATVVPERVEGRPEPEWLTAYGSTTDGSVRIDRIDDLDGGRLLVRVRLVSTQDRADAPPDLQVERICWRSSLPMSGTPPLVELSPAGSSLRGPC